MEKRLKVVRSMFVLAVFAGALFACPDASGPVLPQPEEKEDEPPKESPENPG